MWLSRRLFLLLLAGCTQKTEEEEVLVAGYTPISVDPPNLPPQWNTVPAPSFFDSTPGTYDLNNNCSDPEGDSLTFTLNAGSASLPSGVTLGATGILTADGTQTAADTSGIIVDIDDGTNAEVASSSFTISVSSAQLLRDAGYLLVDDYGADPTGVSDSLSAINACITAAKDVYKPVWFSAGATYRVTGTVKMGMWGFTQANHLQGGGDGDSRPQIVLDDSATGFGDSGDPQPVICCRLFEEASVPDDQWPSDPMDESTSPIDYRGRSANNFGNSISNIRIDCGTNAGAFGIYMPVAQNSHANDIEIDCSNALGGWWGLLGRNSPIINLKVIGGTWQVRNDARSRSREGYAGSMICGLELVGDGSTTDPIINADFVPLTIVGFDITRTTSGAFWTCIGQSATAQDQVCFIDGIIRSAGGTALDNTNGKCCYFRNVYVTGTNDLIVSPSGTTSGTGTWKLINEYCYNDDTTTNASASQYQAHSLIDGVDSTAKEPINSVSSGVAAPTTDYIARHTMTFERIDSGPYVDITDYGATSGPNVDPETAYKNVNKDHVSTADSRTAIENAIAAAATAGHNRVLVPYGIYFVSSPGITLLADTKIFGVGVESSYIGIKDTWQPTSAAYVCKTVDSADATCHWSKLSVGIWRHEQSLGESTNTALSTPHVHDWFGTLHWRAGRNSTSLQIYNNYKRDFIVGDSVTNPRSYHYFTGNAGGKHFGVDCSGRAWGHPDCRAITISGTSQPLHIYGCNTEITKANSKGEVNIEIQSSSNIRLYSCKREGDSATILINNSTNVCFYGLGDINLGERTGHIYGCKITGTSDDILIALGDNLDANRSGTQPYIDDEVNTAQIDWGDAVSVVKLGTPDDTAATI
jgi:hypothetical protein